jgi:hypothetical protein
MAGLLNSGALPVARSVFLSEILCDTGSMIVAISKPVKVSLSFFHFVAMKHIAI